MYEGGAVVSSSTVAVVVVISMLLLLLLPPAFLYSFIGPLRNFRCVDSAGATAIIISIRRHTRPIS